MATFEELVGEQQDIGEEIQRLIRNFKKDPADRKTVAYYQDRSRRLDKAWGRFEANDNRIRLTEDDQKDHDYFKRNYYQEIQEIVLEYQTIFENATISPETSIRHLAPITNHQQASISGTNISGQQSSNHQSNGPQNANQSNDPQISNPNGPQNGLIRKLKAQMAALTRQLRTVEVGIETQPQTFKTVKLKTINQLWEQIEDLNFTIWQQLDDPCAEGYEENNYIALEERVQQAFVSLSTTGEVDTQLFPTTVGKIPLSKVTIPTFNGDYIKWNPFYDLFDQLVHKSTLPKVQKLWYLKSNLTGEAENLIKHLSVSEANYDTAWSLLQGRYNNKRVLTSTLVTKLLNQQLMTTSSSKNIKELHDTTQECLLALQNLKVEVKSWDPLLLPILLKKLDRETVLLFEQTVVNHKENPKLSEFLAFLETRFQTLEAVGCEKQKSAKVMTATNIQCCNYCRETDHPLFACHKFLKAPVADRQKYVMKNRICMNCLRGGHMATHCSSRSCTKCSGRHNTLLHRENALPSVNNNGRSQQHEPVTSTCDTNRTDQQTRAGHSNATQRQTPAVSTSATTCQTRPQHSFVLLGTALIKVTTSNGRTLTARALLDSGSQINIITKKLAKCLDATLTSTFLSIEGIGRSKQTKTDRAYVTIQSRLNSFTQPLEAYIFPEIITVQPSQQVDSSSWEIPSGIELADPSFDKPGKIDVLLGAEFFYQIQRHGQLKLADTLPRLQNTVFGWVVSGKVDQPALSVATCGVGTQQPENVTDAIEKFWKLEEIPKGTSFSTMEKRCEAHFLQNTTRDNTGRFIVRLPFREDISTLGDSKKIAINRFLSLEQRLLRNESVRTQYVDFMREYHSLGHMTPIDMEDVLVPNYFIPHHCVFKPESTTTKLRVVFDASTKTSSGRALNDIMHTGPKIQTELFTILLRFRMHRFVFTADVQKMYRQIMVHPDDRRFQLIVWREGPQMPLQCYQLNTVTYGTRSAPFLAIRTLHKLAEDGEQQFPLAAAVLKRDFYVDDCLHGSNSLTTLKETQTQLTTILNSAGLRLRKWCSNHEQLLSNIAEGDQEVDLNLDEDQGVKTLGLTWKPKIDAFCVKVNIGETFPITKRVISSDLPKLFDPLGLLGPVIVRAKIFLQEIWQEKASWDEALPHDTQAKWSDFRKSLNDLNDLQIPRHVFKNDVAQSIQLHCFADASEKAYGAAIYCRARFKDGTIGVRLLCAKSKVAPLQKQTLPRLELCAALLSAELTSRVRKDLDMNVPIHMWTDSEIVLSWINSSASSFQTFVSNRIAQIQELTAASHWKHVNTKDNPADILSRGVTPHKLRQCAMWFYGPRFLYMDEKAWPTTTSHHLCIEDNSEKKIQRSALIATEVDGIIYNIQHGNSFKKLQRVIAYMLRFVNMSRKSIHQKPSSHHLTPWELDGALMAIIRAMQHAEFSKEFHLLKKYGELPKANSLQGLSPFIDTNNIMRVGGRLDASALPYDAKHQMLIPYNDPISTMILEMVHKENMHCGPQALLANVRQKFWPVKGKIMARSVVQKCVSCTKMRPKLMQQVMGNLPSSRVTPARPFIKVGVDFCGPFMIHYKLRGKRPTKAYLAIFCCFTTKAVHMEVVSELSTDAFIAALKRFISRRGNCQELYCDNATNFVGANNKLQELASTIHSTQAQEKIITKCADKGIQFKFIPPRAPNFGGLWEAAVKSAKSLLVRNIAAASLTYEELETLAVEAEGILNSRPLTPMSEDPNDLTALTPGHFLIGEALTTSVDSQAQPLSTSLYKRFDIISRIKHNFWTRWSIEYLNQLQQKTKWKTKSKNISVGDMVIVKEDNCPVMKWPLGRVLKTYSGDDDAVRVVDVRTATGTWKRPICRLAPLPIEHAAENDKDADSQQKTAHSEINEDTSTPPKIRRISSGYSLTLTVLTLLMLPLALANKVNVTNFEPNLGIHFENVGTLSLSSSQWRFIVYYDLDPIEVELRLIKNGTMMIDKVCAGINYRFNCNDTVRHVKSSVDRLLLNDIVLSPKRSKRGAFNLVGNIAGSLFGVLDSEYANEMSKVISNINSNENRLLALLRNQTSVIDSTINLIKDEKLHINQQFKQVVQRINEISKETDKLAEDAYALKLHQLFLSASLQLTLMITELHYTQNALLDVFADAHHGRIHSFLLSPFQLQVELKILKAHLPSSLEVPTEDDDFLHLYKLMRTKAGLTRQHAIFEITLPLTSPEQFEIFRMVPIPAIINSTLWAITPCSTALAIGKHRDQYIPLEFNEVKRCTIIKDDTHLCSNLQIRHRKGSDVCSCELGLFLNETQPTCNIVTITSTSVWVQLERKNQWIFAVRMPTRLSTVCGKESSQLVIRDTGILTLSPKCSVRGNLINIKGYQIFSTSVKSTFASFGPVSQLSNPGQLTNVSDNWNLTDFKDYFKNFTMLQNSLNQMDVASFPNDLKAQKHFNIGSLLLSILCMAAVVIIIMKRRCTTNNSDQAPQPAPRRMSNPTRFSVHI